MNPRSHGARIADILERIKRIKRYEELLNLAEANTPQLCIIKDVKFVDSKNDQLIQLADMVAGSIRRGHDPSGRNQSDYSTAIQTIRQRDKSDIWVFR